MEGTTQAEIYPRIFLEAFDKKKKKKKKMYIVNELSEINDLKHKIFIFSEGVSVQSPIPVLASLLRTKG